MTKEARFRATHLANGLCVRCVLPRAENDPIYCTAHRAYMREQWRASNARKKRGEQKRKAGRSLKTDESRWSPRNMIIVDCGLSPASLATGCDICGEYREGQTLMQAGRWMVHEQCHEEDKDFLVTLALPRLDYHTPAFAGLTPRGKITLMKRLLAT